MRNPSLQQKKSAGLPARSNADAPFTENRAWQSVGGGWQRVFGSFKGLGFSIEWHEFYARQELDWGASFHPDGVELCLNLEGNGYVEEAGRRQEFAPATAGFYRRRAAPLTGRRAAGQRHSFLTVEFSNSFLARNFAGTEAKLHPMVRAAMEDQAQPSGPATATRLTADQQQIVATLRQPPVNAAAQPIWYQCKGLELAVTFFSNRRRRRNFSARDSTGWRKNGWNWSFSF